MSNVVLSVLVGVLILLLLCLIAVQRKEIKEIMELSQEAAGQTVVLFNQVEKMDKVLESNVKLLTLLAGDTEALGDSANVQSTETSEDKKNNKT